MGGLALWTRRKLEEMEVGLGRRVNYNMNWELEIGQRGIRPGWVSKQPFSSGKFRADCWICMRKKASHTHTHTPKFFDWEARMGVFLPGTECPLMRCLEFLVWKAVAFSLRING